MAFKLNKKNFNFGKGTKSGPNRLVVGLLGTALETGKAYVYGKQALKEYGLIDKDKTDLPGSEHASVAGKNTALINEALHQYNKYKNKDKSEEKSNKEKKAFKGEFFKNKEEKQEQNKSKKLTWAEAKKNDPNLSKYVAERKKHKKGSPEYNKLQNKINAAYKVKKRH